MTEAGSYEREPEQSLAWQVAEVFERRGDEYRKGRRLIFQTYEQKFAKLVETLPPERRDNNAIKIQKFLVSVNGFFSEYGARFSDFMRNVLLWPLRRSDPSFPRDKFYQIELARAKAWGVFARDTTKTATAERKNYRDHFLPGLVASGQLGAAVGALGAVVPAIAVGAIEGSITAGLLTGGAGIGIGAAVGAALGGAQSLILKLKDRMLGEPVVYYNLNSASRSSGGSGFMAGDDGSAFESLTDVGQTYG